MRAPAGLTVGVKTAVVKPSRNGLIAGVEIVNTFVGVDDQHFTERFQVLSGAVARYEDMTVVGASVRRIELKARDTRRIAVDPVGDCPAAALVSDRPSTADDHILRRDPDAKVEKTVVKKLRDASLTVPRYLV